MVTKSEARELVDEHLRHAVKGIDVVIQDDFTIERPFGWVFFYQSKEFVRTRDFRFSLLGNAPIIVDKRDGSLHYTGTAQPVEHYISEYERTRSQND